ncbi:hypothetical protein SAMN05216489_00981 [Streptomyces sp. 3213]|uniref:hypothetical protein n=1 Tax=Streptomyces sp. 3213.3 TaxID=1855348 RepID=UPI00089CC4F8|nr:hypothetical protein [Streptomyces sp. 3213.3]SEC53609.1 hypothetical protein SAMN05216489_00981 [Streptomyces sp. 3213] [Streptomyces sp. 3213.3]
MRSRAGVFIGNLLFAALCCCTGPIFLAIGYSAWNEDPGWGWPAAVAAAGAAITLTIPVSAISSTRKEFPGITRRDRLKGGGFPYRDDTFVLLAPRSQQGSPQARLMRADVVEASLVRYNPDGESTFTTHVGNYTPKEFTPLIELRLRVYDSEGTDERGEFEVTGEWRVPSVCLSAITAGRLVVLVEPAAPGAQRAVTPEWPRSALLAGTRTSRLIDLDGRSAELTRRSGRQLQQMRISREAGGVVMTGDTIDLRKLDPYTAARYAALADRYRDRPEDQAPVSEPGEGKRWLADQLPGEEGEFGRVGRRWSRRGGVLVRARFLEMRSTTTFQDHGPVLDTVLRIQPADGTPPFDAARRLTVPMDYLTVLHRTKEVVLAVSPNGRSYVVDWARTNLLTGVTEARVIAPDGRELPVAGRPELIWALMNLLASLGLSVRTPVLDLRKRRLRGVADMVTRMVQDHADPRTCA